MWLNLKILEFLMQQGFESWSSEVAGYRWIIIAEGVSWRPFMLTPSWKRMYGTSCYSCTSCAMLCFYIVFFKLDPFHNLYFWYFSGTTFLWFSIRPTMWYVSLLLELAGTRSASATAFPWILGIRVPYAHIGFISSSSKLTYLSKFYPRIV